VKQATRIFAGRRRRRRTSAPSGTNSILRFIIVLIVLSFGTEQPPAARGQRQLPLLAGWPVSARPSARARSTFRPDLAKTATTDARPSEAAGPILDGWSRVENRRAQNGRA
jgi:hypothetical protein